MVAQTYSGSSSRVPSFLRYALFAFHFIFWLVPFLLNIFLAGSIILLIIHCCAGLAILVYVPAAIILSAKNSSSRFDQAGGEVAYAVVQMLAWIASAVISFLTYGLAYSCIYGYRVSRYHSIIPPACQILIVIGVFSILQIILSIIWIWWMVHAARHLSGSSARQGFRIPAHRLILDSTGYSNTGVTGGGAYQTRLGSVGSANQANEPGMIQRQRDQESHIGEVGVGQNPFVTSYEALGRGQPVTAYTPITTTTSSGTNASQGQTGTSTRAGQYYPTSYEKV